MTTTARKLNEARMTAGLTQQQLSEAADVRQATISDIERGEIEPTVATLKKLAAALNVEVGDLI